MFNKIQLQHKQRFGTDQNPETPSQEPTQINTYDKDFAKPQGNAQIAQGFAVMEDNDINEETKEEPKVKPSDSQFEKVVADIEEIKETEDF